MPRADHNAQVTVAASPGEGEGVTLRRPGGSGAGSNRTNGTAPDLSPGRYVVARPEPFGLGRVVFLYGWLGGLAQWAGNASLAAVAASHEEALAVRDALPPALRAEAFVAYLGEGYVARCSGLD